MNVVIITELQTKIRVAAFISLYIFAQPRSAVHYELRNEYKKWGMWHVECMCGERFSAIFYATALARFHQHLLTVQLVSMVPGEETMSDQTVPPAGEGQEPDVNPNVTTSVTTETQNTTTPDLPDRAEEHRVPNPSEVPETTTTTETVVTEEHEVPHGSGGDNPSGAQPEDAEPNPTPDTSNEETTDGNS